MLRGKTIEPGWYKLFIKNVSQEPASTDGSTNTIFDFTVVDEGPFKDVPVRRFFSEKAPGFAVPLLVACGAKVGADGGAFNMENCKGKTILGYIANGMYNNRATNQVEDFRPLGAVDTTAATAQEMKAPQ